MADVAAMAVHLMSDDAALGDRQRRDRRRRPHRGVARPASVGPAGTVGPMSSVRVPGGVVHKLPTDLRTALIADATALVAWKDITPLARNEFICWVEDAKQEKTRERRIRRTREELNDGHASPLLLARLQAPRAHRQPDPARSARTAASGAGEDLAVEHGEPAVGLLGPRAPRRRDLGELGAVGVAVLDGLLGERRLLRRGRPTGRPTTRVTRGRRRSRWSSTRRRR